MTTTIGNKRVDTFFGVNINPETALHAFRRDDTGLLIYSKIMLNGDEDIKLTNGQGPAFDSMEEFVGGVTPSGVVHNTIASNLDEIGQKAMLGKDIQVRIKNSTGSGQGFILNNQDTSVLDLVKGATYKFHTEDPSTQGYPIFFTTTAAGGSYANEYTNGVLNSRSSFGGPASDPNSYTTEPLTFTVPVDVPDVLYLASGNHANLFITVYTNRLTYANLKNRYYEQTRFDDRKLTYFINDDGFLVARYNQDYTY